jgi:nucleotide-binding universal stress UspA family protein
MARATLLVHVEADEDGRSRVRLASELARRLQARLVGIAARDIVPPLTTASAGPVVVAALLLAQEERIQLDLQAAEQLWREETDGSADHWRACVTTPAKALAEYSRSADLIIVGRKPERAHLSRSRHADPGDVLMHAGRPILVVPPGIARLETIRALVAWKDSRESRRALKDALPLLKVAEIVIVAEITESLVNDGDQSAAIDDVLAYLREHAVDAVADVRQLREASVSTELLLMAERHGADLIVAGGYGHSRMEEWAFGGVTRTLLRHSPKCSLLSH